MVSLTGIKGSGYNNNNAEFIDGVCSEIAAI